MLHHYITKYKERDIAYATSWIQLNILGRVFCFSKKRIKL